MNLEINQLVLTPFGYGTITHVPPSLRMNSEEIDEKLIINEIDSLQDQVKQSRDEQNTRPVDDAQQEIVSFDDTVQNESPLTNIEQKQLLSEQNQTGQISSPSSGIESDKQEKSNSESMNTESKTQDVEQQSAEKVQIQSELQEEQSEEKQLKKLLLDQIKLRSGVRFGKGQIKLEQVDIKDLEFIIQNIGQEVQTAIIDQNLQSSPEPPNAPIIDAVKVDAINQLPKLNSQASVKQLECADDPFPFPNLGVVPSPHPPPPEVSPTLRKPPFIVQLSPKLSEAMIRAKQIKLNRTKQDDRLVQVKLKCNNFSTLSLPASSISTILYLLVKTFFGTRNYYLACVPIGTQIKHLIKLVSEAACENPKVLHNIRIVHPMGTLKEYKDHNTTLGDCDLMEFAQVIMMAQMTFFWDPLKKGKAVVLSNNDCTANKQGDSDFQTVLGTLPMSSGSNYWELKIDKYVDEEDLFVGVARYRCSIHYQRKEIDLYAQPITTGMFWGYICLCARKCGPEGVLTKYGQSAKLGDVIGVLLEFKGGVGTLSFYRNGTKCGDAFNNLTGTFYPAVGLFYGEVQISLDPKAAFPIN